MLHAPKSWLKYFFWTFSTKNQLKKDKFEISTCIRMHNTTLLIPSLSQFFWNNQSYSWLTNANGVSFHQNNIVSVPGKKVANFYRITLTTKQPLLSPINWSKPVLLCPNKLSCFKYTTNKSSNKKIVFPFLDVECWMIPLGKTWLLFTKMYLINLMIVKVKQHGFWCQFQGTNRLKSFKLSD